MQRCCLIGSHWEHSHSHRNGPWSVKSIIPKGSGFPCSQPENAHKPWSWLLYASFLVILVDFASWAFCQPPPPCSPHICTQVLAMAGVFGHPFTNPDCLSSLPAEKGKTDLWPLGAGNICTFTIFNPKPRSCFCALLNCEPSEDEVLQTGVMLLHEIFRKLFASTG